MLLSVCMCTVGGCNKNNSSVVERLNVDGNDVVLKIGDKVYTANDLFGDLLSTESGIKAAYEKILKAIVLNSVEDDSNLDASWDLKKEAFDEDVKTYMNNNSVSKEDAEKAVLKEEGYESVEEMKDAYYYDVKLSKLQDEYWDEKSNYYYEEYLKNRLPYYVRHALVTTGYTSTRGVYASQIDSSDAKSLYQVYSRLAKGDKFYTIMQDVSEDGGSNSTGQGYMMDLTKDDFATEFLHGAIVFDAMLKGKTANVAGLSSDVISMFTGKNNEGYNFNVIKASDIVALNDVAEQASSSYRPNDITIVDDDEKSLDSSIYTAYGSSSMYSRSIIFNQVFNKSGVSVITYDLDEANAPSNTKVVNINGKNVKALTDENGNIVFVVCARTSSELRIHFMVIDVSPFDEKAKLFFSMDQEETIKEMVKDKKAALTDEGKSESEINTLIEAYKKELEEYRTYVDIKGGEKASSRNKIVEEIEEIVKSYAKRGTTTGSVAANEQFLTYDMVEYYMSQNNVTFKNETVKNLVLNYIKIQKETIDSKVLDTIVDGWNDYYTRAVIADSKEVTMKKIPIECSYYTQGSSSPTNPCKYSYEKGFKIGMNYNLDGGEFNAEATYSSYFYLGQSEDFILPTANEVHKEGYTFDGWYYTKDCDEGTKVTSIDVSESSVNNKTVLYAKWVQNSAEGGE